MIINFEQILKRINGTDLELEGGKSGTLKWFTCEALQLTFQDERELDPIKKCARWVLATRIYANPTKIDLAIEEIAEIKKLIGKAYGPLVVGQAWQMLEGKSGDNPR
jgi:hypothetical protein